MNQSNIGVNDFLGGMDKEYIKWDPKFELGIPVIDAQHKRLVEMCNALYLNVLQNKNREDWKNLLAAALRECAEYVQVHFRDEEKLMVACGFSGLGEHKKRHDEFTKKVLDTVNGFSTVSMADTIKFIKFLYEWILSHVAHEDKLYVQPILEYYRKIKN